MTKYKIVERYIKDLKLVGYVVECENGDLKTISEEQVIKLALQNKISNAEAVYDANNHKYEILITNNEEIKNKDIYANYAIVCRILNSDGVATGYVVKDIKLGKSSKVSLKKAWELAINGNIEGVTASIIDDTKVISGDILKNLKEKTE